MEFAKIESVQKTVCPHCGKIIEDIDADSLMDGGNIQCQHCSGLLKLPDIVVSKLQSKKYIGTNIDIYG